MPAILNDIVTDPAKGPGRPHVAGVGISVRAIATDHSSGMTAEEIVADRPPLTLPQVYAASCRAISSRMIRRSVSSHFGVLPSTYSRSAALISV